MLFIRFIISPAGRLLRVVFGRPYRRGSRVSPGRLLRVVFGLAFIAVGLRLVQGVSGWTLALIGVVPLMAGAFDWCLFAPIAGLPFQGKKLRIAIAKEALH